MAIFCTRMLNGEQPVINGDGKQTRDYVFVGDVVRANELALTRGDNGIFNVGTGKETDVNELFRKIAMHIDADIPERHGPAKPGEQMRSVLDASLIGREFGWQPSVDLEEGLKRTVAFFREKI